jgi:phage terminase large subunit GpA-like protein
LDGAAEILRTWGAGLTPDPDLTVSQWADKHRMLSGRASAEPGRYRTARTPYMREIMDRLSPGDVMQRIVFMKAAQVGATEAGNNWIGFAIHQAPGPMLAVQPTVELAKRNSRQRIDPLIDESPDLRDRVKRGQHHAVEGVRGRHPDHDRRKLGGRAALDARTLHLPRRGRRLSRLGRRGR